MTQDGPIRDLSYRHYEGPLRDGRFKWWTIARQMIGQATKRKGFYGWAALSMWWYLVLLAIFWFMDNVSARTGVDGLNALLLQIVWRDQFLHGFSYSQMALFSLTLMIGAGSIANDVRSNAMLVYFSKPITKRDYVIGKWVGIFVPIFLVILLPMLLFYGYCLLSFREYGFFRENKWLILQLPCVAAVGAATHASLMTGISAMFKEARVAGATYAGLYFLTYIITVIIGGVNASIAFSRDTPPAFIRTAWYCSVDGIQIGLAKLLFMTNGSPIFPGMGAPGGSGSSGGDIGNPGVDIIIKRPDLLVVGGLFVACIIFGFTVASLRVKAVEVVN